MTSAFGVDHGYVSKANKRMLIAYKYKDLAGKREWIPGFQNHSAKEFRALHHNRYKRSTGEPRENFIEHTKEVGYRHPSGTEFAVTTDVKNTPKLRPFGKVYNGWSSKPLVISSMKGLKNMSRYGLKRNSKGVYADKADRDFRAFDKQRTNGWGHAVGDGDPHRVRGYLRRSGKTENMLEGRDYE